MGLFDAVLIKDNHLALGAQGDAAARFTPAEAVAAARQFVASSAAAGTYTNTADMIVEVEVDTLEQLDEVLSASPDIVLLDNMSADLLRAAVARRDTRNPKVELEASGGITLSNIRQIAESGVDRISIGALTHSAVSLDFGLDWLAE
jgi:nicotinate-nucleotide pyrophosphorylase (carboxylating)